MIAISAAHLPPPPRRGLAAAACLRGRGVAQGGFTLVEIVIALTIVVVITAAAIPSFKGLREQQTAKEPVLALVRLAKEARMRAIREKRPYQVAFYSDGFTASRYFNPYLQKADLANYLQESETGVMRKNPNGEEEAMDQDTGATTTPKTQLPLAPMGPKLDDHWTEKYQLPADAHYSFRFWYDVEDIPVEGEVVKLWVFQPTGICQPIKLHMDLPSATFDLEFGALTADLVKQSLQMK